MSLNVELIRESFEKAKPIADQVADKFYEYFWEDFPQVKGLFSGINMDKQKKALIGSLVYIVDHIDDTDKLLPYLKSMGERHTNYGVSDEQYDWVGQSLLKTFAHFFGDDWTEELNDQWTQAYTVIADTMKEGAKAAIPELGAIRIKAKGICNQLLAELLEEGIDEEFESYVRAKVRRLLFKALEEESDQLLEHKKAA